MMSPTFPLTDPWTARAMLIVHHLLTFIGLRNPNGRWAYFWSGFGSCLSEFAIIGILWRKVNCHAKGCYRVGLHKVDGTPYITCKKHHPIHPGGGAVSAAQIAEAHALAHKPPAAPDPAESPRSAGSSSGS
ncbi:MAG: hypothetical protein ACR2KJ_02820 [Jatrophihabitans sp.]